SISICRHEKPHVTPIRHPRLASTLVRGGGEMSITREDVLTATTSPGCWSSSPTRSRSTRAAGSCRGASSAGPGGFSAQSSSRRSRVFRSRLIAEDRWGGGGDGEDRVHPFGQLVERPGVEVALGRRDLR